MRIYIAIIVGLLIGIEAYSQENKAQRHTVKDKKEKHSYLTIGSGITLGGFKDMATSPLIYSGRSINIDIGFLKTTPSSMWSIRVFMVTNTVVSTDFFSYNPQIAPSVTAFVSQYVFNFDELYRLKTIGKWDIFLGGEYNLFVTDRVNQSLLNNASGLDVFYGILGKFKTVYKYQRKDLHQKMSFFHKLLPHKADIGLGVDLPIFYGYYRNGNYIYLSDDEETLKSYKHTLYQGAMFSYNMDITFPLKNNKNAIRLGYFWDYYSSNQNTIPEGIKLYQHNFVVSLLFNLK